MIEQKEELYEAIQSLTSKVHGTLKIACASIVGQNWLPKVLKDFVQTYPEAKISLLTGWSSEIVKRFMMEKLSRDRARSNRLERAQKYIFFEIRFI